MMKRIIALLLALILTVGLLPTVALAADEVTATKMEPVVVEDSGDNTTFRKTISENDDGSYKVTLEAWATGKTIVEETKIPLDIVLVLDKSGSMKETFSTKSETIYRKIESSDFRYNEYYWNWSADNIGLWYKVGEKYYKVNVDRSYDARKVHFVYTYTYQDSNGQMQTIGTSTRRYRDPGYDFYRKEVVNSTTTKMDALKEAATSFATTVQRKAAEDKLEHRIAVVSYSTDAYIATGSNAKSALVEVNKGTGLETVKKAINNLEAGGGTQIDLGIKKANEIFKANKIEEGKRASVVIAFTDGTPGLYGYWAADGGYGLNNFNTHKTANAAIQAAYSSINTYKASVYTIGIFDGADNATLPNYTKDAEVEWDDNRGKWEYVDKNVAAQAVANSNRFMHLVSSNYPTAQGMETPGEINSELGENSFYLAASSAGELSEVFDAIGNTISTVTTTLNDKATIVDKVPSNFTISANAENISLKVANCIGENNGALTFATPEAAPEAVKAKRQGNTVLVNGFNFSDKWCGKENDAYRGQKLIVSFDITHNNYGGTQPTNDGACIKDASGESFIDVDNPSIPVKITEPRITGASATKVYDGTGIDVLANVAAEADKLVTGENEGKNAFVDIIVKVKDANNVEYTYTIPAGATTGSWSPENHEFKTLADVKIVSGAVSNYTYGMTITFEDATDNGAPKAIENATATYTITKRPVTLTSGSGEKKYDGAPLTKDEVTASTGNGVGFVTGEGATYNVTGSQTEVGKSDNTFDYTLNNNTKATNYEITKQLGELEVTQNDTEITVTITGNTLTTPYSGSEQSVTGFDYTVSGGSATKADVIVALKENKTARAAGTNAGKYMMGLSKEDSFTVTSSKYSNVKITTVNDGYLEITPIEVTLTSGSGSKEYDGTALTNSKVEATGAGAERFLQEVNDFKATGSVTGTADMTVAQSETNTISYTWKEGFSANNYTITPNPGSLTITPVSQLKITFKTETGGKIDGDTVDIEKTAKRNDPFPTIPTPTPNTSYYFDGWYKDNTKVTSFPTTVTENATYTAKWLSYNSINLDLTGKIQKTLNSDVALTNEIFTINLTLNGAEVPSATATATVSATTASGTGYTGSAPFQTATDEFKLTFTAPGTYIYSIVEEAPTRSGMTYDVNKYNATGHTMTVVVKEDAAHALSVTRVTVDGTADTDATWLTITNNYTEPKEPRVVSKTVVTTDMVDTLLTSVSNDIAVFKSINEVDILYPVVNGEASTLEVPYGTKSVTLLYKITVNAGTKTSMQFEDVGAERVSIVDDDDVDVSQVGRTFTVQFYRGVTTADIYVAKTYTNLVFDSNGECTVENVIGEEIKATTTVTEKDPSKLTINFADFVKKELTATGSKTVDEATFIVDVAGSYDGEAIANALTPTEMQATTDEDVLNTTLTATIKNIVGGNVYEEPFTGSVTVSKPGHYTFTLTERKGTQSGVTYDEAHYQVFVNIMRVGDNLVIHDATTYLNNEQVELIKLENDAPVTAGYIVFKNTIDTGKDDYYPIIIPTIINKDTGMLNKTDHFAYVIGYPDGTVHPNGQITRAEVATIFFRLLRDEVRDGAFTTSNTYSDVAYGKWYNNPISTMSALGIITGYPDGTFKPNKPITRAEFAAIAARFDETQSGKSATFSDVIGHWAAKEIGIAYYNDWIKGYPDGTFKPDQNITRAEAMTLINRVLERKPESPADLLTNMNKWTDNMDTSKWYYLDVQEATNSHGYTRKTFNYELWRQMLPDPDWSRYER